MLSLAEKVKRQNAGLEESKSDVAESKSLHQAKIRDKLLIRELDEVSKTLPSTCSTYHPNPSKLHEFELTVQPDSKSLWHGGSFKFLIDVPEGYNIYPPKVVCSTKLWHPNIDEQGNICLSLLRQNSLDATGWLPTRTLKDVIWGLESLFSDLVDFKDALNVEAANHYIKDPSSFKRKINLTKIGRNLFGFNVRYYSVQKPNPPSESSSKILSGKSQKSDNSTYKNTEYLQYNKYTFYDADAIMRKHRLPQPKSNRSV